MKYENKFVLELCKFENPRKEVLEELMEQDIDYPYVLGHLLINRVGAMAFYTLKKNELLHKMNREFRNSLKAIYEYNLEKSKSYKKTLDELVDNFKDLKFTYAFLKGSYLVDIYPLGLRTSNDIDILIKPSDITKLTDIFKSLDFKQGNIRNEKFNPATRMEIVSSRMNRGETVPFVKEINMTNMKYLEIDVNFSLGFRPGLDENIVTDFLEKTKPLILNGIMTLDNVDFLIHLCAHLYKEATIMSWVEMGRDISLYKYCDIYLFMNKFLDEEFSNKLINRINELGLNKECYYALFNYKKLFECDNDFINEILNEIKPQNLEFLKEVFDPKTNKTYSYDMDYIDWVFCSNRRGYLNETRDERTYLSGQTDHFLWSRRLWKDNAN